MSSSLEYLLANFDEEPAPRPSSMAAFSPSHHCYGNSVGIGHPWIASRASSTAAASSDSATTTRETMAMAMAMEPPRPWNSHPLLPPPHHHESPRASTGGGTLHSPDTTQRHRHPPRDSPAAVPRGLHIHGGLDYLFGYPTVPAHGAAARTSLEEAMDVMSSSFGYQPQSQRGRTLFPAEGCPALEAERAAASMDGGSIDSDDALGEDDGDSIATIDFTSSGDESARDEDDVVDEVEERADVKGGEAARNEESITTSPTTSPTVESAGRETALSASEAADELRQWLWHRSNNSRGGRSHDATTPGNQMHSVATIASPPTESTAAAPVAPPSDPQIPTLPSRARRQAAISCLERISTAIATSGMGGYHSSDDDDEKEEQEQDEEGNMSSAQDDVEDRKPTATNESITNRIRKRNHPCKTLGGKKRKCEEQEPPNEQPEESEAPSPCCICLEIPTAEDLASISGCSHPFCFGCIEKWAERENTCPLCKARFLNIERVNFCGTNNSEKSKKVTNRDQRTDFSFMNSLTGIGMFANLETHGTWPTHIAQLLFSGLGASSIHEGFGEAAARTGVQTRRVERVRTREREATGRNPHPPRVGFSSRRPSNVTTSMGNRRPPASGTSHREPFTDFLDRVNAHRQQQEQIQRIRANVEQVSAFASAAAAAGGGSSSTSTSYRHTFAPFSHATTTRRTTTTTTTESTSPWSSSRSSFHVHVGPHSSSQMAGSSTASPLAFSPFGSPSPSTSPARSGAPSAAAAASSIAHASILGNPFASINITRREEEEEEEILSTLAPESYVQRLRSELERANEQRDEEEDILSTISPSTYIQRLRRELERTSAQFQFSASATTAAGPGRRTGVASFHPEALRRSAFHYSSVRPMRNNRGLGEIGGSTYDNQAGRSAETALEIDDSDSDDDDVVEVVAVEAMM